MQYRNPGLSKRRKEQIREEHRKAKEERKAQRQREKAERGTGDGEDPDIAGIVPGPQPPTEE
jgi:hypothetical protein